MENSYPYKLNPSEPFHLETIPVYGTEQRIEFFYNYKRKTENLYIGNIKKENLLLKSSELLLKSITDYIKNKHYQDPDTVENFNKRLFPKICWLADTYLNSGFSHPLSVHYNPRIQSNVIHPGSIRNHIIKLFQKDDDVRCLYFNTGGVQFDFLESMEVFKLTPSDDLEIELVADHGSIIPHINLDKHSVKSNVIQWNSFIRQRLSSSNFTIKANADIEVLRPWASTNGNIEIEIVCNNQKEFTDDICRCLILSIIGRSFESNTLKVRHK